MIFLRVSILIFLYDILSGGEGCERWCVGSPLLAWLSSFTARCTAGHVTDHVAGCVAAVLRAALLGHVTSHVTAV